MVLFFRAILYGRKEEKEKTAPTSRMFEQTTLLAGRIVERDKQKKRAIIS
jgi:hypothetical protein